MSHLSNPISFGRPRRPEKISTIPSMIPPPLASIGSSALGSSLDLGSWRLVLPFGASLHLYQRTVPVLYQRTVAVSRSVRLLFGVGKFAGLETQQISSCEVGMVRAARKKKA